MYNIYNLIPSSPPPPSISSFPHPSLLLLLFPRNLGVEKWQKHSRWERASECVRVCVHMCRSLWLAAGEGEREKERTYVFLSMPGSMCVRARVRERDRKRERVCVFV